MAKSSSINFTSVQILIVDSDQYAVDILTQILRGFEANSITVANTGADATHLLSQKKFDLVICEAFLKDMPGAELVLWMRRQPSPKIRFLPIIMLTGHTQLTNVTAGRDSGVNLVIKKPVSPGVLFDRLIWSADSPRPFLEVETYIGPDRRFKFAGLPDGVGRRATDLSAEVGAATEPNLSQDEIDSFMKPAKFSVLE